MSIVKYIQGVQNDLPTMASIPPMMQVNSYNPGLPIYLFKATDSSGLECLCFESSVAAYSKCIMTQMFLPKFFEGLNHSVRGNFLLRIQHQDPEFIDKIFFEKKLGREGCGYSFTLSQKGMFKFNGFTYHPFLMRSLTVCYFSCETGSNDDMAWKNSNHVGVAIHSALYYDHKLDMFITNHATLEPVN